MSRPTRASRKSPKPDVITASTRRIVATAARLAPGGAGTSSHEHEGAETQGHRPDEADLRTPEQVLEAAPEEHGHERDRDRQPRVRASPREDVQLERDDQVDECQEGEIRDIAGHPEQLEHRAIHHDRDAEPVFVERCHEVRKRDRSILDDAPFVRPEGQPEAQPGQQQCRPDGRGDDGDVRPVGTGPGAWGRDGLRHRPRIPSRAATTLRPDGPAARA